MKKSILLAISAVPALAHAQEPGIGVGVSARGVVESQDRGGESASRTYNVVEPKIELMFPWQALRFEARYAPLFYTPMQGDDFYGVEAEPKIFHIGNARLSTSPVRGVEVWIGDEMQAHPLAWSAPADTSENLVQTNDARAAVRLERGRVFVIDTLLEGRRFDVFDDVVTEIDREGDGFGPEDDFNGNGTLDAELNSSFVEARVAPGLFWRIGTTNRVGIVGSVSARYFDELTRNDHVAVSGGLEARRRVRETISAELRAVGTQYAFEDEDLSGWEGTALLSWQATRLMGFGLSGAVRRAVDSFGNQADTNDVAVSAFRDFARGSRLDLEGRYAHLEVLQATTADIAEVDSIMGSVRFSLAIRWGVRLGAGYRLWMGSGRGLQSTIDHLAFVGLSWE